ncbi:conserved hypothetical protein [Leishmania major strain Friedlin]|uniref:PH-like domain-containing protein n=1 Tax=Leishmania major TaxID=5664 RepID=Q4QJ59_LEIMA|nr:conserved hypothetical protein [Leishmania major strain Friedlin]CAG9568812.1 hypothetical_protein_-_conserved [Leishmania major strain Friedlin]CAJ02063.1 conserved hypothetical protein [Leishmania major strain Friedlin]|eukprot:XP_001680789.1 conserved hypothetical protein [Leishmania major strain Friedlin]
MAPRTGPRVKVISPNSEAVTVSRSLSVASSAYSSGHVTPGTASLLRSGFRRGEPQRGGDEMAYGGRPEVTGVALPSRRTALRAMDVNMLHETGPSHDKSAPCSLAPSSAQSVTRTTTITTTASGCGSSGSGGKDAHPRRSLPNFFEEAGFSNNSGTERRQWPLKTSTSRSHSTFHHADASAVKQRQQPTSRQRAEDEEAVRRATAALEHAGGAVLRRPFSGGNATRDEGRAATSALGGNTSSLPVQQPERRGLCLPPTIPITSHTRRHRSEYSDYSGNDSSMGSTVSSYKRARSWAEPPPPPVQAASQQPTSASRPSFYVAQPAAESVAQRLTAPRVCPGMFAGLSAIPVGEELFVGADALHPNCTSTVCAAPVMDAATASAAGGGPVQQRYCVRPLWSLVGTFKTSLSGLVTINLKQECLQWSQRNPKGGKQTIKVPLASVLDVFTTRVVQEDEHIEERQYTVVARTSTRPSQVVFGFATATEANHLRNVLKRR